MSDTPRTDKEVLTFGSFNRGTFEYVRPAFARQLETELNEAVRMLRQFEDQSYQSGYNYCLICKEHMGHAQDCPLNAILEKYAKAD